MTFAYCCFIPDFRFFKNKIRKHVIICFARCLQILLFFTLFYCKLLFISYAFTVVRHLSQDDWTAIRKKLFCNSKILPTFGPASAHQLMLNC